MEQQNPQNQQKNVLVEAANPKIITKEELLAKKQAALENANKETKPTLEAYLDSCKATWAFMQKKAEEDRLDPKKAKISSAVAFAEIYKTMEKYLEFQIEQYETLIEPLTDDGYRTLLKTKIESIFKNALTMLEDYKGLRANDEYYKRQLAERQEEFDEARKDLEERNAKVKSSISKKLHD